MEGAAYRPSAPLRRWRSFPVSSLWTRTCALARAAPVESVTVPEMVPPTTCARERGANAMTRARRPTQEGLRLMEKWDKDVRVLWIMQVLLINGCARVSGEP